VTAAVNAGFFTGYPDGSFRAAADITRADALTLLDRVAESEAKAKGTAIVEIVTDYNDLWESDDIVVKVGVPVRWYVYAASGSLPTVGMTCGKTIKIPGLGWGTDTYNKDEGHLTLAEGKNFVYEFTHAEIGDIQFSCWMGSDCHGNVIHVTADGTYTPSGEHGQSEAHGGNAEI
jgi:hypothetical protein